MLSFQIREPRDYNRYQRFGSKTLAVLRAERGDVQRFARTDEVIASGGMGIKVKESGLRKSRANGGGLLQRVLSMAALLCIHREGSAFGVS